jgi:hypothetical protein
MKLIKALRASHEDHQDAKRAKILLYARHEGIED